MAIPANKNWNYLKSILHWDSFMAFHIALHWSGHLDVTDQHNYQGGGRDSTKFPYDVSQTPSCGWRFFLHDNDNMFYNYGGTPETWTFNALEPVPHNNWRIALKGLFFNLTAEAHPDYMIRLQDYVHRLFYKKNGELTVEKNIKRFLKVYNTFDMNTIMIPEAARWGYIVPKEWCWGKACMFPNGFFSEDYANMFNTDVMTKWAPNRLPFVKGIYERKGWTNPISAPTFNYNDTNTVNEGTNININGVAPNKIIYTTNGEDPRLDNGGGINPKAIQATPPVSYQIKESTVFKARQRTAAGVWGALEDITIYVRKIGGCVLCGKIIITELNYNHKVDKIGPLLKERTPDASFMEFKNIGNTSIVLTGVQVISKSIRYRFPTVTLLPNQFWVVAHFVHDFYLAYGVLPNGTYSGDFNTKSGTHSLKLTDSAGNLIQDFTYSRDLPWSRVPDGYGKSLVAEVGDYQKIVKKFPDTTAKHYRRSTNLNGSPFADDPTPNPINLGIKFQFVDFSNDWVEIKNPTAQSIDLSKWAIRASFNSEDGYDFPKGTIIQPNQVIKVQPEKKMKLKKNSAVVLFQATKMDDGEIVHTGDYVEFDPNSEDHALALFS